jgi:transposase-like protein
VKGHGTKFARKKEAAIAALLSRRTFEEAARAVGISPNALLRWQQDPEFDVAARSAMRAAGETSWTCFRGLDSAQRLLMLRSARMGHSETAPLGKRTGLPETGRVASLVAPGRRTRPRQQKAGTGKATDSGYQAAWQPAKATSDCTRSGVPTSPCGRRSARDRTLLTQFLAVVIAYVQTLLTPASHVSWPLPGPPESVRTEKTWKKATTEVAGSTNGAAGNHTNPSRFSGGRRPSACAAGKLRQFWTVSVVVVVATPPTVATNA